MEPQMNTDEHRWKNLPLGEGSHKNTWLLSVSICVYLWLILFSSCSTKPTDMRTLVPAETLVYLETNDLAAALQPIVDSKPFRDVAKSKPDFSALKGIQLAVAVTGFETTEQRLTDESSIGNVQPRFVAVADTHAWNYQAVAFTDQKLGQFVTDIYGADVTQDKIDKNNGTYFTWTSSDGRKSYAQVIDSLIYFGNDESAIDKCLSVRRGDADSIAKTGKVQPAAPSTLASGYVSTDGVAQIASIVGLKFASETSEEPEVQSAMAGILPQLIRNSITEITWTATSTENGVEDKYKIVMPVEISRVLSETILSNPASDAQKAAISGIIAQIPSEVESTTRYNLKNPQVAWRSLLLVARERTDALSGGLISAFGDSLFEPYGIRDPEMFLSSLGDGKTLSQNIVTVKLDAESDEPIVLSMSGDHPLTLKSFIKELKMKSSGEDGWSEWGTDDGDLSIMFEGGKIAIGSEEELKKFKERRNGQAPKLNARLADSDAPITTIGRDAATTLAVVEMLAREGHGETKPISAFLTETRFTKTGMERRTVSDFGLIGSIIAQMAVE